MGQNQDNGFCLVFYSWTSGSPWGILMAGDMQSLARKTTLAGLNEDPWLLLQTTNKKSTEATSFPIHQTSADL